MGQSNLHQQNSILEESTGPTPHSSSVSAESKYYNKGKLDRTRCDKLYEARFCVSIFFFVISFVTSNDDNDDE